jgi:alpha-beta hydrolase superfamily lysophospholipase
MGAAGDAQARALLASYSLRGLAPTITVPIAMAHGTKDNAVRFAGAERLFAEIGSKDKSFKPLDAARTLGDTAADAVADLLDWMCARLTA